MGIVAVDNSPDFVLAIVYCLAYDRWQQSPSRETLRRLCEGTEPQTDEERLLSHMLQLAQLVTQDSSEHSEPADRLAHLQCIQAQAERLDNPQIALIMGGATKIKQYVFESARLPEIRGASALLDRINLVDLPALFDQSPSNTEHDHIARHVREQFARRYHTSPPDYPECVIYANGGEILAFSPTSLAQQLADDIEAIYTSVTLIANSVAVWKSFSLVELAGGSDALAFWQNWEQDNYREHLSSILGRHVATELPNKKCFGELAAVLAAEKFRRREGNPVLDENGTVKRPAKSAPHSETFAYGRRCRSCERRVASRQYILAEEAQPVCEACDLKLREGWELKREWVTAFEKFLREIEQEETYYRVDFKGIQKDMRGECPARKWDKQRLPDRPQDLNEIGQAAVPKTPRGYIGVIYADGNNMGALLETLSSPFSYHHFAKTVFEAMQESVFNALSTTLHPWPISREVARNQTKQDLWIHPFEILSIGGDDLFLIVPAYAALPIAIQIAQNAKKRLSQDPFFQEHRDYDPQQVHRCPFISNGSIGTAPQSKVGLSVGVLLADANTPIFFLQDIVEQLLKSAKGRAKQLKKNADYYGGTVDFMALKSVTMITSKLQEFRASTLRMDDLSLTARPYTLLELQQLLDTVKTLKQTSFPRSQLYALRGALQEGRLASTVDYLYFTERLDEGNRRRLREVLDSRWYRGNPTPWRQTAFVDWEWETVLFDLIELYDFIEE